LRLAAAVVAVAVLATAAPAQTDTRSPGVPVSGTTTVLVLNTPAGNTNSFTITLDIGAFTANGPTFTNSETVTLTAAQRPRCEVVRRREEWR
jgi:hypothetical protein